MQDSMGIKHLHLLQRYVIHGLNEWISAGVSMFLDRSPLYPPERSPSSPTLGEIGSLSGFYKWTHPLRVYFAKKTFNHALLIITTHPVVDLCFFGIF